MTSLRCMWVCGGSHEHCNEYPADTNRRLREMQHLRATGCTYEEIGDRFGLSRERVGQILRKPKSTPSDAWMTANALTDIDIAACRRLASTLATLFPPEAP